MKKMKKRKNRVKIFPSKSRMNFLVLKLTFVGFLIIGQIQAKENFEKNKTVKLHDLISDLKKINKKEVEKILREFTASGRPNRFVGTAGHEESLKFLQSKIKELDSKNSGKMELHQFSPDISWAINLYQKDFDTQIEGKFPKNSSDYIKWDVFTKDMISNLKSLSKTKGKNLIWEKKGSLYPDEILLVSAHYDNILFNKKNLTIMPSERGDGANDNGSGVALMLSLIPILSELDLPRTIRLVFFDFEEMGFLGSRAYAAELKKEIEKKKIKYLGLINLEMVGQDSASLDKKGKYGNMKLYIRKNSEKGAELDQSLAESLVSYGEKNSYGVHFEIEANSFNVSDHINFWSQGLSAVTFSQNWEEDFNENNYHSGGDLVEAVNIKTFTACLHYVGSGILGLLYQAKP